MLALTTPVLLQRDIRISEEDPGGVIGPASCWNVFACFFNDEMQIPVQQIADFGKRGLWMSIIPPRRPLEENGL